MNVTTLIIIIIGLVSYSMPYSVINEPVHEFIIHDAPYEPYNVILEDIIIGNVSCTFTSPGSNNEPVNITNNHYAVDVSYDEVISFIKADKTDEHQYVRDNFMCGEFATMVHNNAERSGIRAHVVVVIYNDEDASHMINAFNTTDKGMIFIDCTGTTLGNTHMDKEVTLNENENAVEKSVYGELNHTARSVNRFYVV